MRNKLLLLALLCLGPNGVVFCQTPHSMLNFDALCCPVKWDVPKDTCIYHELSTKHNIYHEVEQFIQKHALPSQNFYSEFEIHGLASVIRFHAGQSNQRDAAIITLNYGQWRKKPELGGVDINTDISFLFEDGDTLRIRNGADNSFSHIRKRWYTDLEGNLKRAKKSLSYMSYEFTFSLADSDVRSKLASKRIRAFLVHWPEKTSPDIPVMNRDLFIRQLSCLDGEVVER